MKKIFKIMLFVVIATLTFISCNKENTTTKQQEDTILDFNMNYSAYDGATKATKKSWTNGDIVYMIFQEGGANGYDTENLVIMKYDGKAWNIQEGQKFLNELPNGDGFISACHHDGESTLSRNGDNFYESILYIKPKRIGCFSVFCNDVRYTKQNNRINATIIFKPLKYRNQLNIKGLSFDEVDSYWLKVYKPDDNNSLVNCFGFFGLSFVNGVRSYKYDVTFAQPSPGDDKEISFYINIIKDGFSQNNLSYTIDNRGDTIYSHILKPNFYLCYEKNIGTSIEEVVISKEYDKEVTISDYNAYYIDGPTKTFAQIKEANVGDSLGCGWVKFR